MAAMETATKEMDGLPQNINADQEFNRHPMLEWYKENNITTFFQSRPSSTKMPSWSAFTRPSNR
jgi:hypothetical protein